MQIRLQTLFQDVVKNTGRVRTSANRYNTGKTTSNPSASMGLNINIQSAWEEGYFKNMSNSPNRVRMVRQGLIQDTPVGIRKQGKTKWLDKLELETRVSKAAITRSVIHAEQYWRLNRNTEWLGKVMNTRAASGNWKMDSFQDS